MKIVLLILLTLSLQTYGATYFQEYVNTVGEISQVKLREEARDWVEDHIQGIDRLSEQKKIGLYYIASLFFHRLDHLFRMSVFRPFKRKVIVVLLDENEWVTDYPGYAHFKGKTAEEALGYKGDLRLMDTIGGLVERNTFFLKAHRVGRYPIGSSNLFYHELAHFLHLTTFKSGELFKLRKLYNNARKKNTFLDDYAARNVYEYFAQGLEAYISETKTRKDKQWKYFKSERVDLMKLDKNLYLFIENLIEHY